MREKGAPRPHRAEARQSVSAHHRLDTELYYRDGAVRIWPLQLAILKGLLDRPRGTSATRDDCVRAAMPHAESVRGGKPSWWVLYDAVPGVVRRKWVVRERKGRGIQHSLTPRGRAIVTGEVVTRINGGGLYLPGRRTNTATAVTETVVALGYGIDLAVPAGWTASIPAVAVALAERRPSVNGMLPEPDANGILISLAPTDGSIDRIPLTLMLLPGSLTQEQCAASTDAVIAQADEVRIRPEAESAANGAGFTIPYWGGTERGMVGRRFGLITRFAFAHPEGRQYRKETHVAHLGKRQVVVHLTLPAAAETQVERDARKMLDSLRIRGEFE